MSRPTHKRNRRQGTAVVEMAICLPLLVTVVFGSIELANGIFLRQGATAAAYEAARIVTATGGTEQAAKTRTNEILRSLNIRGAKLEFTPSVTTNTKRGTRITVQVTIPAHQNSTGVNMFLKTRDVVSEITMVRQ